MLISDVASAVGKGLFAGLAGTAAMTLSSTIEMKLTGRGANDTPSRAAGKVIGVQPRHQEGRKRFSTVVHWGYGAAWGMMRGLISAGGIRGSAASALHFATVWGTALILLPSLDEAPPPTQWGAEQLATDAIHHAVYAAATGAAYDLIDRH